MPSDIVSMPWTPPESATVQKYVKYGIYAALGLGGLAAFLAIGPSVLTAVILANLILANLTNMAIAGFSLVVLLGFMHSALSSNGKINQLLRLPYNSFINGLTRFFITIDPLSPIDERIKSVRADQATFEHQFETMEGIVTNLKDREGQFRALSMQNQRLGVAANRQGKAGAVELAAHNFGSYKDAADSLAAMRGRLEPVLTTFQNISQAADVTAQKLETERSILKVQWEAQQAVHAATASANRVLGRSKTQVWAMAEQANDVITTKYSEELGHLDHLKRSAQPFMDSINVETGAYSEVMLAQVQNTGAKLIQSTAATPQPSPAMTALNAPSASSDVLASFIH